jgi:hypothetical protein
MRTGVVTSFRVLTWCWLILLAVLSLLPAQQMVRTGFPGRVEHFVAYAGSAMVAMAGYGASRGVVQIIGGVRRHPRTTSSTSLPAVIRHSVISWRQRLERCAAPLLSPSSAAPVRIAAASAIEPDPKALGYLDNRQHRTAFEIPQRPLSLGGGSWSSCPNRPRGQGLKALWC